MPAPRRSQQRSHRTARRPLDGHRRIRRDNRAAVSIIIELNRQITDLVAELSTHFEAHPDADNYHSPPGLGVILGARVLGDDLYRYTTAKSRKNYAGTSRFADLLDDDV